MITKESVKEEYYVHIHNLKLLKNSIDKIGGGANEQFSELQKCFSNTLQKELSASVEDMEQSINGTVWDKLTIAFFGETNAGKSTIIETFRVLFDKERPAGKDGIIVGDGRSDFTQAYEEYPLTIKGRPFTLIDVPGIEGNEKEYTEGIKKALKKAHIVFYVHGHNTKPNAETVKKIKDYLGDWVNVYTIYNIRAAVSNYDECEEREYLYTNSVKKSEELITAIFKDVLGEVYKGNISLQALLAMCSHANFSKSREDLISNQRKLLKYFGSADKILKFSHFKEIEELVYEKSIHFTDEIIEANKQKMISMIRRSHNKLNDTIKNQEEKTKKFRLLLRNFKHDASDAIHSTKNRIVSEIDATINRRMNAIMYGIDEIIDNNQDDKEKSAKAIADKEMNGMNEDIREMIQKSISELKDTLTKMKHHLNAEYCNSMSMDDGVMGNVCMDLNFDTAMSEMDISFGDCMDFLGSVIGFAGIGSFFTFLFPGLATILGGVVGGILYGVRKIFGDGGRSKAKEEAHKSIQQSKEEIKSKMRKATNDMSNNLLIFKNSICELIDKELHALKQMESMINESKNKMVENVNSLKQTEYGKL